MTSYKRQMNRPVKWIPVTSTRFIGKLYTHISDLLDAILKAFPGVAVELFVNAIAKPLVKEEKIERVEIPDISGPVPQHAI